MLRRYLLLGAVLLSACPRDSGGPRCDLFACIEQCRPSGQTGTCTAWGCQCSSIVFDAATEASPEPAPEAGLDAPAELALEQGPEPTLDAAPEADSARPEAGSDAGPEPVVDAALEASVDAGAECGVAIGQPGCPPQRCFAGEPCSQPVYSTVLVCNADAGQYGTCVVDHCIYSPSCAGSCPDLRNDRNNCGACGRACPPDQPAAGIRYQCIVLAGTPTCRAL